MQRSPSELAVLLLSTRLTQRQSELSELSEHSPPPDWRTAEAEVSAIAGRVVRYPTVIQELYRFEFPMLEFALVRFQASPLGSPLSELLDVAINWWDPVKILGQGYLPIADDANDGGPLCVDLGRHANVDSCPVVLWDHDRQTVGDDLYSSAGAMVECVVALAQGSRVTDLATVDPAGAAATYYRFRDDN